jgi:chorismate-pyruvate lyase
MSRSLSWCVMACVAALLQDGSTRTADSAGRSPGWQDDFNARVEALALLQTLNADLLSHDSATLTLERWCDTHKLATPPHVVAELVRGVDKAPTEEVRQLLGASVTDPVRYRRVRLHCGEHVLSEADNWYLPERLTPEMNRLLDTTDTPFGRAVQALHFQRRTLSAKLLWSPLPEGWETGAAVPETGVGTLRIPVHVIEHRAVLSLPNGTPFSVVVETYTGEVLAFPKPPPSAPSHRRPPAGEAGPRYQGPVAAIRTAGFERTAF